MKTLSIIYYFGIIACGIQGSKKSCQQYKRFCLPASFLAAMGGGIFRDLFILYVFPAAFTYKCVIDNIIALCAGITYYSYSKKYKMQNVINYFATLADALGVGTFIAIGVDKSLNLSANPYIALCSGIATALGGGVLSALLCGHSLYEIFTNNIAYRVVTIGGTYLYMHFLSLGTQPITAQYYIILYTFCFIPLTDYSFRRTLIGPVTNILNHTQNAFICIPVAALLYQSDILPLQPPCRNFNCRSENIGNRNWTYVSHFVILLNIRSHCPRHFARGR